MGTSTVQCWGCHKSETHPIVHGKEYEKQMSDLAARGWRRKAFWSPNWDKGPWFCSDDCANNSFNARRAQKYWEEHAQKEFEAYCKSKEHNRMLLKFGAIILGLFLAILTGEFIYAGLQ